MTVVGGNNVTYSSSYFYEAQVYYDLSYPDSASYSLDWELRVYHSTSLVDGTNKAGIPSGGDLKGATSYGSKSYNATGADHKVYASGTKTGSRSYSGPITLKQSFWIEDLADYSGGGARSTVNATITIAARPAAVPSKPANPTNTSVSQNEVTVNMTLPASNGAAISSTRFRIYTAATGGTQVATATESPAATSHTFDELTPATTYYSEVAATNSVGTSTPSTRVAFTTGAAVAPSKPANPTVTSITTTTCTVNMTEPADNGATITGYNVVIAKLDGTVVKNVTVASLTAAITGLVAGTRYKVQYRAASSSGYSSFSNWVNFNTTATAPGAPTGLRVTSSSGGTVSLAWDAPASDGASTITGYKLQIDNDSGFTSTLHDTTSNTLVRTASGMPLDVTLYARVYAINAIGTSAPAGVISFMLESTSNLFLSDGTDFDTHLLFYNEGGTFDEEEFWMNFSGEWVRVA